MEQLPHIDTSSFQLHLFQILNKLKPQQNIVVSSLSIFLALSLKIMWLLILFYLRGRPLIFL